ncbi:hypothetical protein CQA53_09110 [Helicobacter didelphidarum]|uniref:Uncharacterized protein n=1 Tax=Helicobacter didelphidarum TaxID=2040648 RepID=A0A3D8ICB9_9HELI|nr:hypothetical protein [Helicobacter didelphidarum]RDU62695.1 hypothetical protein CQA53_09110 [Helicobacter didelphidarum]
MTDFEKLKNMNLQDIRNKTRISVERLQDIINKNFDNIDPTRAHGFIKILERDLHLNLDDWVQEYDYYKSHGNTQDFTLNQTVIQTNTTVQENTQIAKTEDTFNESLVSHLEKHDEIQQDSKDESNKRQNNDRESKIYKSNIVKEKEQKRNKQKLSGINIEISTPKTQYSLRSKVVITSGIIGILLVVIVVYFLSVVTNSHSSKITQDNNIQKENIEKDLRTYPKISLQEALKDDENMLQDTQKDESLNRDKTTHQDKDSQTLSDTSYVKELQNNVAKNQFDVYHLTVIPKKDVWFAWTDTITKKKGDKYSAKAVTMELYNPTAFHFGNGILTLEIDGEKIEYNQASVMYLLYTPKSGFKTITQKEYKTFGSK